MTLTKYSHNRAYSLQLARGISASPPPGVVKGTVIAIANANTNANDNDQNPGSRNLHAPATRPRNHIKSI